MLLRHALDVLIARFWDDDEGLVVDAWDRGWTRLDDYRGVNATMHTVEALLAAGDVLGEVLGDVAGATPWRVPEHFTSTWQPLPEHHRDVPAHPFQPYGATVGHGLEWARLLVAVDRTLGQQAPAVNTACVLRRDHRRGSWIHELDEHNRPSGETWPGKPDVHHAYQAALLPCLPTVPSFASALAAGGLGGPWGTGGVSR